MAAKKKSTGKDKQAEPNLESNKDTELEKKVDAMMSVEEVEQPAPKSKPEPAPEPEVAPKEPDTPEPAGAPLLPTEELPDLEKTEPEEAPVQNQPAADYAPTPVKMVKPEDQPEQTPRTEKAASGEINMYDAGTNKAIDEIVAAESGEHAEKLDESPPKKSFSTAKTKSNPLKKFLTSKAFRRTLILLILVGLGAAAAFPASRYYALNSAGVRSSSSVTVLDDSTNQPLKNADFSLAGVTGKTNELGEAKVENIKLGPATLKINKPAFAEVDKQVTVGWGSNPLGEFKLKAVGSQFKFKVTDFLSKKPVGKVEASSGEATALSNEKGEITLTVPQTDKEKVEIQIKAEGYRTEKLEKTSENKDTTELQLVPDKKHVFISKRSGRYDVYKIDVDGKNEEKVLPGNGSEQMDTMSLVTHPDKNMAALVSTRDNIRTNGVDLSTLTLLDLSDNSAKTVTQSQRIQIVGWDKGRIIYVKVAENSKADSTDRHRLVSYDIDSETEKDLASSNYFNDVISVKDSVYYSPAGYQVNGTVGLYKINVDGSNKKTVFDKEVWNLLRTSYDKLSVTIGQEWYELNLDNDAMTRMEGSPASQKNRIYVDRPGNNISLWVDERDGKGNLISYDQKSKEEKILQAQAGLKNPVRWLSGKHVVFRVSSNQETADYIMNTEGGEARKIRDVTDSAGVDRWYYY